MDGRRGRQTAGCRDGRTGGRTDGLSEGRAQERRRAGRKCGRTEGMATKWNTATSHQPPATSHRPAATSHQPPSLPLSFFLWPFLTKTFQLRELGGNTSVIYRKPVENLSEIHSFTFFMLGPYCSPPPFRSCCFAANTFISFFRRTEINKLRCKHLC